MDKRQPTKSRARKKKSEGSGPFTTIRTYFKKLLGSELKAWEQKWGRKLRCWECYWYADAQLDGVKNKGICNLGTAERPPFTMAPGDIVKIAWGHKRACNHFHPLGIGPPKQRKAQRRASKSPRPSSAKPKRKQKPARYKCNSCGHLQADGAWEKAMDAQAKAMGRKGFVNLSASPECLNCGSTDLIDLRNPPSQKEQKQKAAVKSLPERAKLIELLREWERFDTRSRDDLARYGSTPETRKRHAEALNKKEQIEKKVKAVGKKLAKDGGHDLMYRVCISLNRRRWQNIVSASWHGIAGWMH